MEIFTIGLLVSCFFGNTVWGQSESARQRNSPTRTNSQFGQRASRPQSVQNRLLNPTPRLSPPPTSVQSTFPVQQQMFQDSQAANMIRPLNFQLPPTNMFPQATPLAINSPGEMSFSPMIPQISMIPSGLPNQQPGSSPFGPSFINPIAPQQRLFMQPNFAGMGYGGQNNEFGDVPSNGATYAGFGDPYGSARDGDGLNSIYRSSFSDVSSMERNGRYGSSSSGGSHVGSNDGYANVGGSNYGNSVYGGNYGMGQGNMASVECLCTADYIPVCGSDGVTYSNLCRFRCDKQQSTSTTARKGECVTNTITGGSGVSWEVYDSPFYRPGDLCNWRCYKGRSLVCDQNGLTYQNPCVFWKNNCRNVNIGPLTLTSCPNSVSSGPVILDSDGTATVGTIGIAAGDGTIIIKKEKEKVKFDFGGPFGEFPSAEKTSATTVTTFTPTSVTNDVFIFPSVNEGVVSLRENDGVDPWSTRVNLEGNKQDKQVMIRQR